MIAIDKMIYILYPILIHSLAGWYVLYVLYIISALSALFMNQFEWNRL